jgi:hypothetical protein
MPVLRPAGGPTRPPFRYTWRGGVVLRQINDAVEKAFEDRARAAKALLQAELHRVSHEMADKSFAEVGLSGRRRSLKIGSDAPHTYYHEIGTAFFEGHPQIRSIADRIAPTITPAIQRALR